MGLRGRLHEVLDDSVVGGPTARFVHRALVTLITINIVAMVIESIPSAHPHYTGVLSFIEIVSLIVFTVEYALRVWVSVDSPRYLHLSPMRARLAYICSPGAVIDILSVAPFYVALLLHMDWRVLLVLRVLRYFKLMRYSPGLTSLAEAVWHERRALLACLVVLLGAVLVTASLMHLAEHAAQPDKFASIPDAMYWAMITLTTVGYGDVVPATPAGKIVASLTALIGLVMLALPIGIIASAFAREIHRRDFVVTWTMVARVPLFSGLDAAAIAEIMRALRAETVPAGSLICRRGEEAHSMYFVASGEVEIDLGYRRVRLGEGQFFGEVAVLKRSRRSGTVCTVVASKLLSLDAQDLHTIMERHPAVEQAVRRIAETRLAGERIGQAGDLVSEELGAPDLAFGSAPAADDARGDPTAKTG